MTGPSHEQRWRQRRNARLLAIRCGWPPGALRTCWRLEQQHEGWLVSWATECKWAGRPAGYLAARDDHSLVGGDELRVAPEDGVSRNLRVFGETPEALGERIAAVMERVAEAEERHEASWRAMRRGLLS